MDLSVAEDSLLCMGIFKHYVRVDIEGGLRGWPLGLSPCGMLRFSKQPWPWGCSAPE